MYQLKSPCDSNRIACHLIAPGLDIFELGEPDIIKYPKLVDYLDIQYLSPREWYYVVKVRPDYADLCTKYDGWRGMSETAKVGLILTNPDYVHHFTQSAVRWSHHAKWVILNKHPQLEKFIYA